MSKVKDFLIIYYFFILNYEILLLIFAFAKTKFSNKDVLKRILHDELFSFPGNGEFPFLFPIFSELELGIPGDGEWGNLTTNLSHSPGMWNVRNIDHLGNSHSHSPILGWQMGMGIPRE